MPRSSQETRRRILEAAYGAFYADGFSRVGVDAVAEKAGVTKRTLYYHFESKDALLAAVLEHQKDMAEARIESWMGSRSKAPGPVIAKLFRELEAWAKRPRWQGAGFTRLAMELAGLPGHPARAVASRHKAAVEAAIAARLKASGVRRANTLARQIKVLLEGAMTLTLIHGDAGYVRAAAQAAQTLVAAALPKT